MVEVNLTPVESKGKSHFGKIPKKNKEVDEPIKMMLPSTMFIPRLADRDLSELLSVELIDRGFKMEVNFKFRDGTCMRW